MKKGKGTKAMLEKVRQLSKDIFNISKEKNIVQVFRLSVVLKRKCKS